MKNRVTTHSLLFQLIASQTILHFFTDVSFNYKNQTCFEQNEFYGKQDLEQLGVNMSPPPVCDIMQGIFVAFWSFWSSHRQTQMQLHKNS